MEIKSSGILLNWKDYRKHSRIFVETGSCYGRTIEMALDAGFEEIYSVEAKEEFFNHCTKFFRGKGKVNLWLGKSVDKLGEMLQCIDQPAVFWLDAHVSGEQSAGYADWVEKQGESDYDQHKILKGELEIIFNHRTDHIILIDDQNGENIMNRAYIEFIISRNPNYKFSFIDEQMGKIFYKDKILVCVP